MTQRKARGSTGLKTAKKIPIVDSAVKGRFDRGQKPTICLVNKATTKMAFTLDVLARALQVYLDQLFTVIWNEPATITTASDFQAGCWAILFSDNADQAGALGYHDLTPDGLPLSHVFVQTTLADGENVSTTASHELAEMLVDPGIQMGAQNPADGTWYAYEVCDAVEAMEFVLKDFPTIPLSNFQYPSWFESFRGPKTDRFDYLRGCTKPFQILKDGYMPVFRDGNWTQVFGCKAARDKWEKMPRWGHRTSRRNLHHQRTVAHHKLLIVEEELPEVQRK